MPLMFSELVHLAGIITIGLTKGMPQNSTPGLTDGSIAYHTHDGQSVSVLRFLYIYINKLFILKTYHFTNTRNCVL